MASYTSIVRDMLRPTRSPSSPCWDPNTAMPLLTDRIVILTGPTSGIGYETLRQLVLSSAHVYLFGRSLSRLQRTRDTIAAECAAQLSTYAAGTLRHSAKPGRMSLVQCDLSDLVSIQSAVKEFLTQQDTVDLVFGNAGVMVAGRTAQNYEQMFGTNVLGHHALLRLLLPALRQSAAQGAKPRVILTASDTHRWVDAPHHLHLSADAINPHLGHIHLYGRSKLGNIYTTSHLAAISDREQWGLTVCSVHPGGVKSQLGSKNRLLTTIKNAFLVPASLGAVTQLWGGTAADAEQVHARYLVPYACVGVESELASNQELRSQVWTWCEQQCVRWGLIDEHDVLL